MPGAPRAGSAAHTLPPPYVITQAIEIAFQRDADFEKTLPASAAGPVVSALRATGQPPPFAGTDGPDLVESQKGIPMGRVEEILEAIESEKRLMAPLGAATFGTLRLLAHWASQTGGLRIPEDELLAEVRAVGEEEWQQISAAAARRLQEAPAEGDG